MCATSSFMGRFPRGMWVGVGSLCKRNGRPEQVLAVLEAIRSRRPDLRLHGFGVKLTALAHPGVSAALASANSMAWSFHARKNGRDPNSWREAEAFAEVVSRRLQAKPRPWQSVLPLYGPYARARGQPSRSHPLRTGGATIAAPDAARRVAVLLDLRVVRRAQAAQVVESIVRRRFDTSRPCDDVVDMRRRPAAAGDRAAIAVARERRLAQRLPMRGRVIAVSRQCRHPKPGTSGPTGSASRRFGSRAATA